MATNGDMSKVLDIVSACSEDLKDPPSLERLPTAPTGRVDWDTLVVMYKKLASLWSDSEHAEDAAEALRRAAVIAEGRDPELAAHLAGLGVDVLSPSREEVRARLVSSRK